MFIVYTCDVQMAEIVRCTFYGIVCSDEKIEKCILDSVRDIVGNIFISIYTTMSLCVYTFRMMV